MKHLDLRVQGLVQGVFFRVSAQRAALALRLTGTVRNEADGSVRIEAEGEPAALDEFVAWCRKGPPRSRVDRVDAAEGPPVGYEGFEITG